MAYGFNVWINGKRERIVNSAWSPEDAQRALAERIVGRGYDAVTAATAPLEARLGPAHAVILSAARQAPIVYACVSATGAVRYVGMSRKGLARPLDPRHRALADCAPDDGIYVLAYDTAAAALEAEQALITAIAPPENRQVASVSRVTARVGVRLAWDDPPPDAITPPTPVEGTRPEDERRDLRVRRDRRRRPPLRRDARLAYVPLAEPLEPGRLPRRRRAPVASRGRTLALVPRAPVLPPLPADVLHALVHRLADALVVDYEADHAPTRPGQREGH